jgi:hypothetical protein
MRPGSDSPDSPENAGAEPQSRDNEQPSASRRTRSGRNRRRGRRKSPAVRESANDGPRPVAPTKAETALLPPFKGLSLERVLVPRTKVECEAASDEILAAGVAGFDTEAKPTFKAGERSAGPHVVQFALTNKAFIFQLHRRECRKVVAELIASGHVLKVGFGLKNDHGQIRDRLHVRLEKMLDLDVIFRQQGYRGQIGVRGAMGALLKLGFPKSKATTTSNWAAAKLTPKQLLYAANDAYAALKIMEALDLSPENLPGKPPKAVTARPASPRRREGGRPAW